MKGYFTGNLCEGIFFYNSIIRFTVFPSQKLCFLRSFPVTM